MIDAELLANTIIEVSKDRGTLANLKESSEIIQSLSESKIFNSNFTKYVELNYPNLMITLDQVFEKFNDILGNLNGKL